MKPEILPDIDPQNLAGPEHLSFDVPDAVLDIDDEVLQQVVETAKKYEAFVSIDPNNKDSKKQHKLTILRILCMDRVTFALSMDRLRRVCGFTRHLSAPWENLNVAILEDPLNQWSKQLQILDPLVIIVKCKGIPKLFAAVAQIVLMKWGTNLIDSLVSGHIRDCVFVSRRVKNPIRIKSKPLADAGNARPTLSSLIVH